MVVKVRYVGEVQAANWASVRRLILENHLDRLQAPLRLNVIQLVWLIVQCLEQG